ncbi:MAG: hypothetical protein AAGK74_04455, partial [Chloroflexota bacterium]
PLYYTVLHAFANATGDSIFVLRWLSFAFGMVAIALAGHIAGRIGPPRARMFAVLLCAVSVPLVWASREMRMYTLLAVLLLVMTIAWGRLRTRPVGWAWAALLLAELAALYTHNTGPVIAAWINTVTMVAWLAWIVRHRGRVAGLLPHPVQWFAGQVIVLLLYLPYFLGRFLNVAGANSALVRRTVPGPDVWGAFWLAPWEMLTANPSLSLYTLPLLLLVIVLVPYRSAAARWLAVHVLVLTGGLLLALAVLGNELHGRYVVMIVPLLLALIGAGLARFRRVWVGAALMIPFVAVALVGWQLAPQHPHDNARAMVQHYADTLTADDTVLAWSYADRYELAYYWSRMDVAARRVTLPEGAALPDIMPLLPTDGDIATNVWYTQRADYRGMLSCVLSHGTTAEPSFHQVAGMAALTYRDPVLQLPDERDLTIDFTVGQVQHVGTLPESFMANQAVCVPVRLLLTEPTPAELKAALIVRNPLDQEIARADAVFATANQRTSVDGTIDEVLTAYPLVRLPHGAPPVDYELVLRVYDESNLSGYDVLLNGAPAGKDAPVGTWRPTPGAQWPVDPTSDDLRLMTPPDEVPRDVRNGGRVSIALLWEGNSDAPLPGMTLEAVDGTWSVAVPPIVATHDNAVLDWREFQIPLDAGNGEAVLQTDIGQTIARYTITEIPLQTEPPPVPYSADAEFSGVGSLVGYDYTISADTVEVILVWQAADDAPAPADYTVFVQALDAGGQLVAQSDAQPVAGSRPTTGWRPGEIIVDEHTLPVNAGMTIEGAMLIVGLYDSSGTRLTLPDGADATVLEQNLPGPSGR